MLPMKTLKAKATSRRHLTVAYSLLLTGYNLFPDRLHPCPTLILSRGPTTRTATAEDVAMTASAMKGPKENHRQAYEQLHVIAELAGSVAHALHNPLTSILLHADILQEEL